LGKWGGSILLALIGLAFILGGLSLLLGIRIPFRYMGGLISVAIGLLFLAAVSNFSSCPDQKPEFIFRSLLMKHSRIWQFSQPALHISLYCYLLNA